LALKFRLAIAVIVIWTHLLKFQLTLKSKMKHRMMQTHKIPSGEEKRSGSVFSSHPAVPGSILVIFYLALVFLKSIDGTGYESERKH
jgi:hypothetical protein